MGEASGGDPESFEDVGRGAEHHDADLCGLSPDGYGGVFGGLSVVGEPAAGDHFLPGQGWAAALMARSSLTSSNAGTGARMIPTAYPGRSAR